LKEFARRPFLRRLFSSALSGCLSLGLNLDRSDKAIVFSLNSGVDGEEFEMLLGEFLKGRFWACADSLEDLEVKIAFESFLNESLSGGESPIEINGGDDRLQGVGQNFRFFRFGTCELTLAEKNELEEFHLLGDPDENFS
jgi:hypothetical protein